MKTKPKRTMHARKWNFDGLKPGEGRFFKGAQDKQNLAVSYGLHLIRGRYIIKREVDEEGNEGLMFYLLKDPVER
jgi:hypothetical protein